MRKKSSERREKVFLMREKGMTFREIGIHFGFTRDRARQLYIKARELKELHNRSPFSSRLSARSRNALQLYFNYENIIDDPDTVAKLGRKKLSRIKNLGIMSVEEISKTLYELGCIKDPDLW
ncbi:MAG: hypothetical protein PVG39_17635 [Desulfobacteraceae bacterium]